MPGYYVIKKSNAVQPYHFVLHRVNNEPVLTSENYTSKQNAQGGIASCQVNSQIDSRYERKKSSAVQPYSFVLKGANAETIGRSENYTSETARETGIASVKSNGKSSDIRDQS